MSFSRREITIFVFQIEDICIRKISMATAWCKLSGVRLPNYHTLAKLEKYLHFSAQTLMIFMVL